MTGTANTACIELLTFQLADQEYAFDIMSVREIRGWTHATPLPHAPPYTKGVINLRGTVLPVIDLCCRLGLPARVQNDRNVIIVVKTKDVKTGLLVDAVSDIVTVGVENLQAPPHTGATLAEGVISALTLVEGRMIRLLNLPAILNTSGSVAA
ncbi:chemotaxis protein CheW [Sulfitobacter sp. F26204]|uniref:chemotaxis protein CheW n=1 Tax=Sulfitobacter sp. F26204 TaxID=2996014 RepID=UPI00225E1105|nr:chemotaxis protein CheW [Sulfitobacter sp. F26204]MCX7559771.1 chemotaxis protein CheW [Sulfitobacter sp. F26204]